MTDIDKKLLSAKWLAEHTLTPDQFNQLIQNKVDRMNQYRQALKQRETIKVVVDRKV